MARIEPYERSLERRKLLQATITAMMANGDPRLAQLGRPLRDNEIFFSIAVWIDDARHNDQLSLFLGQSDFFLELRASGFASVTLDASARPAPLTSLDGSWHGYVLRLSEAQVKALRAGVNYSIHPRNQYRAFPWKVGKGVSLRR